MGQDALCNACAGTTLVVYDFEVDLVEPYDPDRHELEQAERCPSCDDGLVVPPKLCRRFKLEVLACWPSDRSWCLTAGQIRR